ncbi:MAG: hypothetical protein AB8B97_08405 [Granulosicoccus sp.]
MRSSIAGFCTLHKDHVKRTGAALALTLACFTSSTLLAGTQALPDGQANVAGQFESFDLELSTRASADSQRSGGRLVLPKFSDHFVLFFETHNVEGELSDIALSSDVEVSGDSDGGGIYFTGLPDWRNYTINLRLSTQSEDLEVDSNIVVSGIQAQTTFDNRSISLAALLSPVNSPFSNGTNYYLTLGASYQRSRRTVVLSGQDEPSLNRNETDVIPQLAAGIVYPFKRIRLYASVEYEEELALGLGLRLQLKKMVNQ